MCYSRVDGMMAKKNHQKICFGSLAWNKTMYGIAIFPFPYAHAWHFKEKVYGFSWLIDYKIESLEAIATSKKFLCFCWYASSNIVPSI